MVDFGGKNCGKISGSAPEYTVASLTSRYITYVIVSEAVDSLAHSKGLCTLQKYLFLRQRFFVPLNILIVFINISLLMHFLRQRFFVSLNILIVFI